MKSGKAAVVVKKRDSRAAAVEEERVEQEERAEAVPQLRGRGKSVQAKESVKVAADNKRIPVKLLEKQPPSIRRTAHSSKLAQTEDSSAMQQEEEMKGQRDDKPHEHAKCERPATEG